MNLLLMWVLLALWGKAPVPTTKTSPDKPAASACRQLVLDAYGKLAAAADSKQTQYIEFKATVFYRVPGQEAITSVATTTKLTLTPQQTHLVSDDVELLKDQKTTVAISKKQGQVLITPTVPGRDEQFTQLLALRDGLLREAQLVSCASVSEGGKASQISFSLPAPLADAYQIKSMKFWIEPASKNMQKVELQYTKGQPVVRQVVAFQRHQTGIKPAKDFKQPTDLVFDAQGKLLPAYKGYKLIDTRAKNQKG